MAGGVGIADGCGGRLEAFREAVLGGQRPATGEETSGRGQSILVRDPGLSRRRVRLQATGRGTLAWRSSGGQGRSRCHRVALPTAGCLNLPEGRVQTGPGQPRPTPSESEEGLWAPWL